jgi:hypothetical protein
MTTKVSGTNGIEFPDNTIRGSGSLIASIFKNLAANANGLNANVNITADAVVLEKTDFSPIIARSVNRTINTAANGVDGLDTGAIAASTWYYIWIISDGINVRALASLSRTAPTMPSGYTYKARVGSFRTDGTANKFPFGFQQFGRRFQYKIGTGTNLTTLPVIASGGTAGAGNAFVAASITGVVPPTASEIGVTISGIYAGNNGAVAPNATYQFATGSNAAPLSNSQGAANGTTLVKSGFMIIESDNIYWYCTGSTTVSCFGWIDNL